MTKPLFLPLTNFLGRTIYVNMNRVLIFYAENPSEHTILRMGSREMEKYYVKETPQQIVSMLDSCESEPDDGVVGYDEYEKQINKEES